MGPVILPILEMRKQAREDTVTGPVWIPVSDSRPRDLKHFICHLCFRYPSSRRGLCNPASWVTAAGQSMHGYFLGFCFTKMPQPPAPGTLLLWELPVPLRRHKPLLRQNLTAGARVHRRWGLSGTGSQSPEDHVCGRLSRQPATPPQPAPTLAGRQGRAARLLFLPSAYASPYGW